MVEFMKFEKMLVDPRFPAIQVGVRSWNLTLADPKAFAVRVKIAHYLSHEFGVSRAEIARHLGVCTSAIAKVIQNLESGGNTC